MPISRIEQATYNAVIAGSFFDATNTSYMDWSVVGKGNRKYGVVLLPATVDYAPLTFGGVDEHRWSVPVVVVVPGTDPTPVVHSNIVGTMQEMADMLTTAAANGLSGSADIVSFQLMDHDQDEVRGTRWNLQYWLVQATEWV